MTGNRRAELDEWRKDRTGGCAPDIGAHRYWPNQPTCACGQRSRADMEAMFRCPDEEER